MISVFEGSQQRRREPFCAVGVHGSPGQAGRWRSM